MKFQKYNSLENHYQQRFIDKIVQEGLEGGSFVCTEKVHGANFSFWYNGDGLVRTAKRSGFCELNFFSCHIIFNKYQQAIKNMYVGLVYDEVLKEGDTMVVYGEIFGGHFFGASEPSAKNVQGGMDYHPNTEFMAFDIGIEHVDGVKTWMDFEDMEVNLADFHIPMVPKLFQGTLQECLDQENDFCSHVPAHFGLTIPEGKKAQSEGFVIRPVDGEKFLRNGSRVIIKSKNAMFKEVGKAGKKSKVATLSDNAQALLRGFSGYINRARVQSVQSKIGEPEWKGVMSTAGLLFQDAMEEYNKLNFTRPDDGRTLRIILEKEWTPFNAAAMRLCSEEVRNYYKEVI